MHLFMYTNASVSDEENFYSLFCGKKIWRKKKLKDETIKVWMNQYIINKIDSRSLHTVILNLWSLVLSQLVISHSEYRDPFQIWTVHTESRRMVTDSYIHVKYFNVLVIYIGILIHDKVTTTTTMDFRVLNCYM